ncbi:hypothetical protein K2173_007615 [Erythroxylum novogranatense]|uniref:Transcriptional adapter n=1 Tax=Erythroxylum novogranatense TaxID=1862640 RepID=A0AAV8S9A0_9ROSI|nr:hypothetical protein K2173_007615 [Erythroxylum novogranatense]
MGRSRAVSRSTDDDPNLRSKRKRTATNPDNTDTAPNAVCQDSSEERGALYHCNYCHKDISGMVRIKCALCPDFDLCVECFSVGAELTPHKCNHPYRVMDNLSFPLIHPEWNADEEILLLEGIEMYGFGNWTEVAEHVGTKKKSQCIDHYNAVYMNSPFFPLPDMSRVRGKSREELLEMAKSYCIIKKEVPASRELMLKEESTFAARVKNEVPRKEESAQESSSITNIEVGSVTRLSSSVTLAGPVKVTTNLAQANDAVKVEEGQADRSTGEKKPRISGEGPSMTELNGFNFKRQEFEVEYDNDAEQLLADMEFKDSDSDAERELKLRVLHIYSKRLDERKRRKDFILERNLLYSDPFEKDLSAEEKEIYQRYKVFMRFHSREDHEELMKSVIEELRIAKRIKDLQDARAAGCQTAAEANKFIEQKRKKETEESLPGGKVLQRPIVLKGEADCSPHGIVRWPTDLNSLGHESSSTSANQALFNPIEVWDISGFPGADLLSESEKQLCIEIRILPSHYLNMLEIMSVEVMKGSVTKKADAHSLFRVEPSKVDRVYDMLLKKGLARA